MLVSSVQQSDSVIHIHICIYTHTFFSDIISIIGYHKILGRVPCALYTVCGVPAQSCLTVCDPMDCSPPGSSVHVILQARILEWFPFPSPGDLPDPGIKPLFLASPALTGRFFTSWAAGEAPLCIQSVFVVYLFYTWQCVSLNPKLLIFSPTSQAQCFLSSGEGLGFRPRPSDCGLSS